MTMPLARICTPKFLLQASLAAGFLALAASPAIAQRTNLSIFVNCEIPAEEWVPGLRPVVGPSWPRPPQRIRPDSIKKLLVVCSEDRNPSPRKLSAQEEKALERKRYLATMLETAIRGRIGSLRVEDLEVTSGRDTVVLEEGKKPIELKESDAWVVVTLVPEKRRYTLNVPYVLGIPLQGAQVQVVSLSCSITIQDHRNVALFSFAPPQLSVEERGSSNVAGGNPDFTPEDLVMEELVGRHADRFVTAAFGFKGDREFRLVDARQEVQEAANVLKGGNYYKAMDKAVTKWQLSQLTDHRAAFVASLGYMYLGRPEYVGELCGVAETNARMIGESAAPCQDLHYFVDRKMRLTAGGGGAQ